MRLALIAPGGFGASGRDGLEIPALVALAQELGTRHEVHVFAASGPGGVAHRQVGTVQVHQLGDPSHVEPPDVARRLLELTRLGWRLRAQVDRFSSPTPFEVIHAFWAMGPGLLAGLLGRQRRIPVVLSMGGGEAVWLPEIGYGGSRSWFGRKRLELTLSLPAAITVGSEFARAQLTKTQSLRAQVIPWGVRCEMFAASVERPAGPPWRLLHVGSLNRVKDQSTLLDSFAAVVARLGDVHLDVVGEDTLAGETQRKAQRLDLGERVRFLGFQPQAVVAELYRKAHLLVMSSRYESQAVVVMEAAAAGLPTVGTAVGILPTLSALSPRAAAAVPAADPTALAQAIMDLLLDEERRRAIATAAQQFSRSHDVRWTALTFEDLYERLRARGLTA